MSLSMDMHIKPVVSTLARTGGIILALIAAGSYVSISAQSASRNPTDGHSFCLAGDEAMTAAQWEAANDLYTRCLRSESARFEILSNMGTAQSHLGRMEEAIKSYQQALALAPDNPRIDFNLAVAFVKAGNCNAAVDHLSKLRQSAPDLRYEELLAFCYFHLGRYSLAARAAEKVKAIQPDDPANALILGSAYSRLGQYDMALPLITLTLKAAGSAEGHLIMGETLLGLRRYHPAVEELTQAAKLQPDLPGLNSALGVGDVGLGDSEGAIVEFNKALNRDPHDYQANYYLGRLKRLDRDTEAAKKYLDAAIELRPGSPEVLFEIAAMSVTARHYSDAEPLLLKVIEQEPTHVEAHFLLAECYQKSGRSDDAARERGIFEKLKAEQNKHNPSVASYRDEGGTSSSTEKP